MQQPANEHCLLYSSPLSVKWVQNLLAMSWHVMGQIVLPKLNFYIRHFFESRKRTVLLKTHHNSSKIRLAHYQLPPQVDKGVEISIVQSVWRVKHLFSAWNDFRTTCAHLKTVRISSILPYTKSTPIPTWYTQMLRQFSRKKKQFDVSM